MVIYKTTNLINGMWYVGRDAKNNPSYLGSGSYLKRAIKKYGFKNFKKEILESEIDSIDLLKQRETFWINNLKAHSDDMSYNIKSSGEPGISACEWTLEMREHNRVKEIEWRKNNPDKVKERDIKISQKARTYESRVANSMGQGRKPFYVFCSKTLSILDHITILKEAESKFHVYIRVISQYLSGKRGQFSKRNPHNYYFSYSKELNLEKKEY